MAMAASVSAVDLSQCKLLHWSGIISVMRTCIGSRLVVDGLSPTLSQGQKTKKSTARAREKI